MDLWGVSGVGFGEGLLEGADGEGVWLGRIVEALWAVWCFWMGRCGRYSTTSICCGLFMFFLCLLASLCFEKLLSLLLCSALLCCKIEE